MFHACSEHVEHMSGTCRKHVEDIVPWRPAPGPQASGLGLVPWGLAEPDGLALRPPGPRSLGLEPGALPRPSGTWPGGLCPGPNGSPGLNRSRMIPNLSRMSPRHIFRFILMPICPKLMKIILKRTPTLKKSPNLGRLWFWV